VQDLHNFAAGLAFNPGKTSFAQPSG